MVTIGILLSPGFQVLSLSTSTVFELANRFYGQPFYRVDLISEQGGSVVSSMGFTIDTLAFTQRRYDTTLVLGDNELIKPTPGLIHYLQQAFTSSRRLASACTGSFLLATAGLLDGRKATTHWYHARTFRETFPNVKLEEDRIFTVDGKLWTSAGMTACIDLALALVEQDLGAAVARDVARKLVVYHRRAGGQSQFSALLELAPKSDRVQTALTYAKEHLREELSVEQLAEIAHLSPRQFSRLFSSETGQSPAKAIENLRLEAARLMLESGAHSIDSVARESGFGDPERMRRAFIRAFGQPPQMLRRALHLQA